MVGPSVVDVLVDDHREIEYLLGQAGSGPSPAPAPIDQRRLSVCLAELARHIVIEEEYLYPLVRETVPGGDRMAAEGLSLGRKAEGLIKEAEAGTPVVDDLADVVHRHVEVTERDVFPALRRACAPDQLDHLAGVVEMAKRTAPTHAHPDAPRGTAWFQILSPGLGLVDKVRDAVTGRPTRPGQL